MKRVAEAVSVSRSSLAKRAAERKVRGPYEKAEDALLLPRIEALVDERAIYGFRRPTALLSRQLMAEGKPRVNHKRIFHLMRLQERHTGKRTRTYDGTIITLKSNLRWCSDAFDIRC